MLDPVVAKLPVLPSIEFNLGDADDVNTFKLPVVVSIEFNLVVTEDVCVFKLPVVTSSEEILLSCVLFVVATDDDIEPMFSPPLVREPVTKRLWTFICK
jgi:hypothetical protein